MGGISSDRMLGHRWRVGRRGFLVGTVSMTAILALAGCGFSSANQRYRITVEVDTPQGLRTGSSVWNIDSHSGPAFPGPEAGGVSSDIRGEAVAVELPGGTLFALMRGGGVGMDYPALVVQRHLAQYPDPRVELVPQDWAENDRRIQHSGVSFDLAEQEYPILVRFQNISNPTSVEEVRPNELNEEFGDGIRLRRITIEMTEEPVTRGLIERLPWLSDFRDGGGLLGNMPINRGNYIYSDFIRGQ